jgi:hypothetical protein
MKDILQKLLALQALDFGEAPRKAAQAAALRTAIPPEMLEQYERRRARGKKGIALVCNRVCMGCRMQVPIAVVATLMRGTAVQVCGNCGIYLCLPVPPEIQAVQPVAAARPATHTRSRQAPRPEAQLCAA